MDLRTFHAMLIHRLPSTVDDAVVLGIALPGCGRSTLTRVHSSDGLTLFEDINLCLGIVHPNIPW